jgi:hypothetical protein
MNYGYKQSGWQTNNRNQPYRSNTFKSQQKQIVKHSGCRFHEKDGKVFVAGWKYSRATGMLKFIASPYVGKKSSTKRFTSKNGKEWENWAVKITKADGTSNWLQCLYQVASRRVFINDMYFMMSPNAKNGGYIGRITSK